MQTLLQTLIFGLALGGVIALCAVGLTLSYGVTGFINFAYGEFLTLGAYATIALAASGLALMPALALAIVAVGVSGIVIARIFYDPLMRRGLLALLVTSVGIAFVLNNLVQMAAGANPVRFPLPLMRPWTLGEIFVPREQVLIFVTALVAMLIVHLMLRYTLAGKKMRAIADDPDLARAAGVRVTRVLATTWFVSAAIGALGGVLLAITQVTLGPQMGWHFLLVVFAAVLLGGIGSPAGAAIGGLVIGLAVEFGATYIAPDYAYSFAFVVLILVLIFRPRGLFAGAR